MDRGKTDFGKESPDTMPWRSISVRNYRFGLFDKIKEMVTKESLFIFEIEKTKDKA